LAAHHRVLQSSHALWFVSVKKVGGSIAPRDFHPVI
jgi:hypothetical protein